jgi:hypothetical protein
MKTSVEIDFDKIELAKKLGDKSTIRQILDEALDAYISQLRRKNMHDLLGTHFFEGNGAKMRKSSGNPRR